MKKTDYNKEIYLRKDWFTDSSISNEEVAIYIGLSILWNPSMQIQMTDIPNIYFALSGSSDFEHFTNPTVKALKEGASSFIKHRPEVMKQATLPKRYFFKPEKLTVKNKNIPYIVVNLQDINDIVLNGGKARWGLLKYYLVLLSTIMNNYEVKVNEVQSYSNVVGSLSQERLAELTGVTVQAIIKYNKILEGKSGNLPRPLIYVNRDYIACRKDNKTYFTFNIYGRYKDKEIVDYYAKDKYKNGGIFKNKDIANYHSSLMRKYKNLVNGTTKIDKDNLTDEQIEELKEIYIFIHQRNYKIKKKAETIDVSLDLFGNVNKHRLLEKIQDETFFEQFDCLKGIDIDSYNIDWGEVDEIKEDDEIDER